MLDQFSRTQLLLKQAGITRLHRAHCICPKGTARKCTFRRQVPGSNAFVPANDGLIIAGEVINDLTGFRRSNG